MLLRFINVSFILHFSLAKCFKSFRDYIGKSIEIYAIAIGIYLHYLKGTSTSENVTKVPLFMKVLHNITGLVRATISLATTPSLFAVLSLAG